MTNTPTQPHQYASSEIELIVDAVGALPDDEIEYLHRKDDDGPVETVSAPRIDMLGVCLDTAAREYFFDLYGGKPPTPAQLAEALGRVEKEIQDLERTLLGGRPNKPLTKDRGRDAAGLLRAMNDALKVQARKSADYSIRYAEEHISSENRQQLVRDSLADGYLMDAWLAISRLKRWTSNARAEAVSFGKLPNSDRHRGNVPLNSFIQALLNIYLEVFERDPSVAIPATGGPPSGPTIRYLQACIKPVLGDQSPTPDGLRKRIIAWNNQNKKFLIGPFRQLVSRLLF